MKQTELGSRLRQLRVERGLSLRDLAATAEVDHTYLSKIENGRTPGMPSVRILGRVAKALNMEPMELIMLADRVPEPFRPIARNDEAMRFFRRATEEIQDGEGWREMSALLEGIVARRKAP